MSEKIFLPNPKALWEIKNNRAIIHMADKELGLDEEGTKIFSRIVQRKPIKITTLEQEEFIDDLIRNDVILPYNPENPSFFPPGAIAVEITHKCNLQCEHCYVGIRENPSVLSLEAFKKIVREMEEMSCYALAIGGGEPTLHPDFEKILRAIYNSKVRAHIVTNGTTNIADYLEKYADKKRNSFEVTVSIDGPKDIHEKIRKNAVFDRIIENIQKLAELGWKPHIQTTVSLKNYYSIPRLLDQIKNLPIQSWAVKMEYPVGNAKVHANMFPSPHEFVEIRDQIHKWWERSGIKTIKFVDDLGYFPPVLKKPAKRRMYYLCSAGVTQVTLDADGNITPCTLIQIADGTSKYIAGNIYVDSLKEVWNTSELLWKFRLLWPENEICSRCGLVCAKCPATVLAIAKNLFKPDPRCSMFQRRCGDVNS
ncbi:radical SAM/SPASM domain-containing protein [Thermococcus celer]|uniref:Radical SAM core domain-containing protein n=1 Tax=Thermococcus celer Vu 13 = JCM 8558 TaxID=1293037 RepID=A0A218P0K0_THECE|nr:radical SAM protein [Thermococcus celer]ASI98446.1 hypothetical protein A3L02_02125 [Thermococcus celer Vu 13 = JCM 8558]